MKEFGLNGKPSDLKVGDTVEVYLERVENALGEAVLSRDKARREESWTRLERMYEKNEKVTGVIFNKVKGGFTVDLDGAVAFLPGSQVDIRPVRDIGPLMHQQPAVPDSQDGSPPRQHRCLASLGPRREPRRAADRDRRPSRRRPDHRRPGQEHHRLRCVHRSRRHRRPLARHRHGVASRQPSVRDPQRRRYGQGADHSHQSGNAAYLARHESSCSRIRGRRSRPSIRSAHASRAR